MVAEILCYADMTVCHADVPKIGYSLKFWPQQGVSLLEYMFSEDLSKIFTKTLMYFGKENTVQRRLKS